MAFLAMVLTLRRPKGVPLGITGQAIGPCLTSPRSHSFHRLRSLTSVGVLLGVAGPAAAQDSLINFNNGVLGSSRLVTDFAGKPLVGTNWVAQLFLDTPTGLQEVTGPGSGLFYRAGEGTPGVWAGGLRLLEKVGIGQAAQLEVRVWDLGRYSTYEAALQAGGMTGTSGLFGYQFIPSSPLSASDSWMKNFPSIRMADQPALPPLIEGIRHPEPQEGAALQIEPLVTGGTPPLRYLWQTGDGVQGTNEVLDLTSQATRPGLLNFNLTVTDAGGRSTPPALFQLNVSNRSPVVRGVELKDIQGGKRPQLKVLADYAWPDQAVRVIWQMPDGRVVEGRDPILPELPHGRHDLAVQVEELSLVSLYDNLDSVILPAEYLPSTELESGDEIEFAIPDQILHEVSIYYFADLSGMTDAERSKVTGELRIYRNDGPNYLHLKSRAPGTLLYQSKPFRINTGYFLQRFTDLNVKTTDRVTWTVVWNNLPQISGKEAGLIVGDTTKHPASSNIGKSFNDFWARDGEQWDLYQLEGNPRPVANFATRAAAIGTNVALRSEVFPFTLEITNSSPWSPSLLVPEKLAVGIPGQFQVAVADPSLQGIRYDWSFGDGTTADGATVSHAYSSAGTFDGRLRIVYSGSAKEISSYAFKVTVDPNRVPIEFLTNPPTEAGEGREYSATVAIRPGRDGQTVALNPALLPKWLSWKSTSPTEGVLQGKPERQDAGLHPVRIEATDGVGVETLEFFIRVTPLNRPPTISAIATVDFRAADGLEGLAIEVDDPDLSDTLTVTADTENPTGLPQDRLVLSGSGTSRKLRILPVSGDGSAQIRLSVHDGRLSASRFLQVRFFTPKVFALTVKPTKGGTLTVDPQSDLFEQGFPVRVMATVQPGWKLVNWLGLPGGPIPATHLELDWSVSESATISAEFVDVAAPLVSWESPLPGISESRTVTLTGWISDNDELASATLRRGTASSQPLKLTQGRYSLSGVSLEAGENLFTLIATDRAGNSTTNETVLVWNSGNTLLVGDARDTREGQRVEFPIQLKTTQALSGLTFNLRYADYVDFLADPEFTPSGFLPGGLITLNTNMPGMVRVTVATAGPRIPGGLTTVGTFGLRVRSLLSPIGLMAFVDPEVLDVSNELGDPVAGVSEVSGQARLLPRRLVADANGNNRLDIGDASLVQRLLVGLDPKRSWDIALNDLNKSGSLDSGDVVRVMRAVVGLDPQPKPSTRGAEWPTPVQPKSGKVTPSWVELTPGTLNAQRGGIFEAQIRIRQAPARLRGLAFDLVYPAQFMSLISGSGYVPGPALPATALKYWNDTPTTGRLRFAASSETNWPTSDGVIATFRFRVGQTVPPQWQGEYGLRAFEISIDGYQLDNTEVPLAKVALEGEIPVPKVNRIRLNSGGTLQFDMLANTGSTVVLEGSSDLRQGNGGWKPLTTRVHDQLQLFLDQTKGIQAQAMQFYRIRTQAPAYITQPGVKGSR